MSESLEISSPSPVNLAVLAGASSTGFPTVGGLKLSAPPSDGFGTTLSALSSFSESLLFSRPTRAGGSSGLSAAGDARTSAPLGSGATGGASSDLSSSLARETSSSGFEGALAAVVDEVSVRTGSGPEKSDTSPASIHSPCSPQATRSVDEISPVMIMLRRRSPLTGPSRSFPFEIYQAIMQKQFTLSFAVRKRDSSFLWTTIRNASKIEPVSGLRLHSLHGTLWNIPFNLFKWRLLTGAQ